MSRTEKLLDGFFGESGARWAVASAAHFFVGACVGFAFRSMEALAVFVWPAILYILFALYARLRNFSGGGP